MRVSMRIPCDWLFRFFHYFYFLNFINFWTSNSLNFTTNAFISDVALFYYVCLTSWRFCLVASMSVTLGYLKRPSDKSLIACTNDCLNASYCLLSSNSWRNSIDLTKLVFVWLMAIGFPIFVCSFGSCVSMCLCNKCYPPVFCLLYSKVKVK